MLPLAVLGCSGMRSGGKTAEKKKPEPVIKGGMTINTGPGEVTVRGASDKSKRSYNISWQTGKLNLGEDANVFSGSMETVKGSMFQNDMEASTFEAEAAVADRTQQKLTATGRVIVRSKTQKAEIACDQVVWMAAQKLVKASGNVQLGGAFGRLSNLKEVWATPDLKVVATPEMFKR